MTQCPLCKKKLFVQPQVGIEHKLSLSMFVCIQCNKNFDMKTLEEIKR